MHNMLHFSSSGQLLFCRPGLPGTGQHQWRQWKRRTWSSALNLCMRVWCRPYTRVWCCPKIKFSILIVWQQFIVQQAWDTWSARVSVSSWCRHWLYCLLLYILWAVYIPGRTRLFCCSPHIWQTAAWRPHSRGCWLVEAGPSWNDNRR